MKVISAKELRKELSDVLQGPEATIVTRRGVAVALIVLVESEEGQKLLAERRDALYEAFIGNTGSGETNVSKEHGRYLYG
jgi:antitoxin (DNA-binding transcriptional repressor) of toxin-antitoxin stability system